MIIVETNKYGSVGYPGDCHCPPVGLPGAQGWSGDATPKEIVEIKGNCPVWQSYIEGNTSVSPTTTVQ